MRQVTGIDVRRAGPVGERHVPVVHIVIEEEMPHLRGSETLAQLDARFLEDARVIEKGLIESLPGGTYDRLLGLMLQRKASHFIVPWAEPTKEEG
jgi:hypothetical protein